MLLSMFIPFSHYAKFSQTALRAEPSSTVFHMLIPTSPQTRIAFILVTRRNYGTHSLMAISQYESEAVSRGTFHEIRTVSPEL